MNIAEMADTKERLECNTPLPKYMQENVIAALAFDDEFAREFYSKIPVELVESTPYKTIFSAIVNYISEYEQAPGKAHLADLLNDLLEGKNPGTTSLYIGILDSLYAISQDLNVGYVRAGMTEFIHRQNAKAAIMQAAQDLHQTDKPTEQILSEFAKNVGAALDTGGTIRALTSNELQALQSDDRCLLEPLIPYESRHLLAAPTGIGKTHFAYSIAAAVATGTSVFGWKAINPELVVYVDGEMSLHGFQALAKRLLPRGYDHDDNLKIICNAALEKPLPDLAKPPGQRMLEDSLPDGTRLLILDNVSCLMRSGVENDAESWTKVEEWLDRLRRAGIAVLLVHHTGKDGRRQRGTSKREGTMDSIIYLSRPEDYDVEQGCRFIVRFEKLRLMRGDAAVRPFEARWVPWQRTDYRRGEKYEAGWGIWVRKDVSTPITNKTRVLELNKQGLTQAVIAEMVGVSQGRVSQILKSE